MTIAARVRRFCCAAFALWAHAANADTTFCVSTVGELANALNHYDFSVESDETVTIRIVQGTYNVGNALTLLHGAHAEEDVGLKLLGGYTAGCASRQPDPRNTVLDGADAPGSGIGLLLKGDGALLIEGLTFTRFKGATSLVNEDGIAFSNGEALLIQMDPFDESDEPVYEVRQSRFVRNAGRSIVSLFGTQMRFVGNVVADNALDAGSLGAVAFSLSPNGDAYATATNNTIVNTTGGPGLRIVGLYGSVISGSAGRFTEVTGNVLWNNATDVVFTEPDEVDYPLLSSYNLYGSANAGYPQSATDLHVDPRFANPAAGNYRLASNSPAINKGPFFQFHGFPARDADGKARIVGSRIDIGAYESTIDDTATAIVTNTGDNGNDAAPLAGSLRAAIKAANAAAGPFTIKFNFGGGCPRIVALTMALPDIVRDVTIDATTLAGWTPNADFGRFNGNLCLYLNGAGSSWAFRVPPTAPSTARLVVRGIGFAGFTDAAVKLEGGRNHRIWGSQFGAIPFTASNRNAIRVTGNSGGAFVGGYDDPGAINLVAGSSADGIYLDNAAGGSTLANNVIGFQPDGDGNGGNASGVTVYNSKNNVLQYNVVGYSAANGVVLSGAGSTGNRVQYNTIGHSVDGYDAPNGGAGALVNFAAKNNTIGSPAGASWGGNVIAASGGPGVWISPSGGAGNSVLSNAFDGNAGLDIDLAQAGATANQTTYPATGPNSLQNYPVLGSAQRDVDHGVEFVAGYLSSAPNTTYRIDLYYASHCGKPGAPARGFAQKPFAQTTLKTGSQPVTPFTLSVPFEPVEAPVGYVSATATDPAGNTSEIGNCIPKVLD